MLQLHLEPSFNAYVPLCLDEESFTWGEAMAFFESYPELVNKS